ncbi:NBS-LRR type resistance protein [Cucumis melo var. makuwa]|uniref:NBS-LRR type resistance protein n=1 Tax=Cucumis melo var. makuwa TaxID=1194695 RepID=A0A5A7T8D6_CUCMM|nr:NBS-LRR type resistance protein [Cucumis melo var. makuwa]TYK15254.1 NBS-LRR type resistance protein [Cucumis melo var. makuwa]
MLYSVDASGVRRSTNVIMNRNEGKKSWRLKKKRSPRNRIPLVLSSSFPSPSSLSRRLSPPHIEEQSRTNKVARQKQSYNHSSGSKSFLQRHHKFAEQRAESVDHVELFQKTHVHVAFHRGCTYRIKYWNSSPSLSQRVVSHSLRMRYAIRCWVNDQATQKALVGDPSRKPARRHVRAVSWCHVRNP